MTRTSRGSLIGGADMRHDGHPETNVEGYEDLVCQASAASIRTVAVRATPQVNVLDW